MQHTAHILMIKPVNFDFNAETAINNSFQLKSNDVDIQKKALQEFELFITTLKKNGVDVMVVDDTMDPYTPDSIFPNNWISFHDNGTLLLYPMFAINRRLEKKEHVLKKIKERFLVSNIIDLTHYESGNVFLEGTGSMVLDRDNKIAYACISPRTDQMVLQAFCDKMGFEPISFIALDTNNQPIYHTNVMMCVADSFVVICLDSLKDSNQKKLVADKIKHTGKVIIEITFEQMNQFAGNMLQVNNIEGKVFTVMSTQAYQSLTQKQIDKIEFFNTILHADITTIETNGGGSARCMMAEIFLPIK